MWGIPKTLAKTTRVDIVGYGIQNGELFTRYRAVSQLSPGKGAISDEFLKLSANPGKGRAVPASVIQVVRRWLRIRS